MLRSTVCLVLLGLVSPASGQPRKTLSDFPHEILCLAFSPDGKTLATGTRQSEGGKDAVKLWDVASGKQICRLEADCPYACTSLAFSPEGKTLVMNAATADVLLWDLATRKVRLTIKGDRFGFGALIAVSPDSKWLALTRPDPSNGECVIRLHDIAEGKERRALEGYFSPFCLVFSPDGMMLAASASGGRIALWDCATGKLRASLEKHQGTVNKVAFSPDSKTLYSLGNDQLLVYWDTGTGKPRNEVRQRQPFPSKDIALSPDGRTLALVGGCELRLFDLEREEFWPGRLYSRTGRMTLVAFSSDGKHVALGTSGGANATMRRTDAYLYEIPKDRKVRD
jgi:WD40 repeat protein